jgi:UbiD family decarboxylase
MPYRDLREYLAALEASGMLHRVRAEVDKDWEIAAVCRVVFQDIPEERRPALLFERVRGHTMPVCVGVLGASRWVYAKALETTPEAIPDKWAEAQRHPLPPRLVPAGPVHEVVERGEVASLSDLPVPVWTRHLDPGPYLTAPFVVTRDPETGTQNLGTYRCQIKGPRTLGMWVNFLQHARQHIEPRRSAGERVPVAIVLGADPAVGLCSVSRIPYGLDELAVAGGLRGEPLDVVRCVTSDLLVPATAEIVIEGEVLPRLEEEGPFGEYTGYMGPKAESYVVEVQAITRRRQPIFQAFLSQMPPSESSCIRGWGRECAILKHLRDLRLPVRDVHLLHAGGSAAILAISLRPQFPSQAQQAMWAAWTVDPALGKITVVVDDDIDVRDPFQLAWALAWRVQPDRDVVIVPRTPAVRLDPSQAPDDVPQLDPARRLSSKLAIDATKKHRYPEAALPPAEDIARVRERWAAYGLDALVGSPPGRP